MTKKIALVTGANKGIGFDIARGLGAADATVLLAARSADRGERAAAALRDEGLDVRFLQLDVTESGSIAAAATTMEESHGRLDILVNNAGIALADGDRNTSELTLPTLRKVYEVNVFGVVAVTNAFIPLLRRADAARIVNVSSEVGSMACQLDRHSLLWPMQPGAYGSSKSALNMLTVSYAKEFWDTPIKVNAVTPGHCATDLNGHRGPRTAAEGARAAVHMALLGDDGPTGTFRSDGEITYLGGTVSVPW